MQFPEGPKEEVKTTLSTKFFDELIDPIRQVLEKHGATLEVCNEIPCRFLALPHFDTVGELPVKQLKRQNARSEFSPREFPSAIARSAGYWLPLLKEYARDVFF